MSASDGFRDYLIEEGQRAQMERQLNDLLPDPERLAADAELAVQQTAQDEIGLIAEQAEGLDDEFVEMVGDARGLKHRIDNGMLTVDEAKTELLNLRHRYTGSRTLLGQLRPRYDSSTQQVRDPGARRDELIEKYGL